MNCSQFLVCRITPSCVIHKTIVIKEIVIKAIGTVLCVLTELRLLSVVKTVHGADDLLYSLLIIVALSLYLKYGLLKS